jgi:PKD repeat protein
VTAIPGGATQVIEETSLIPITISFSAKSSSGTAPFSYYWNFGDGTTSTSALVVHTFPVNCAYDVHLQATDAKGSVTSKDVLLELFSSEYSANSTVVCPVAGTAGLGDVWYEGGNASGNERLQVLVDGAQVASPVAGRDGFWASQIGGDLPPEPNGSSYTISVLPLNRSEVFVTVEGIAASPTSGVPGDSVTVLGRSYPASTSVSVYLGGVQIGKAQSDAYGSFNATFTIPAASPLTSMGTYQFTTSPQAIGAQAYFAITSNTTVPPPSTSITSGMIPWLLIVIAALVCFILYTYMRRSRSSNAVSGQNTREGAPPVSACYCHGVVDRFKALSSVSHPQMSLRRMLSH